MPAEITFVGIRGPLSGTKYSFTGRTTCVLGRSPECNLRIPDIDNNHAISRHHCLIDINPPDIRVRDLGSLNGTYVNGQPVGRRPAGGGADNRHSVQSHECDLAHGDELQIGDSVFQIHVRLPIVCPACLEELPAMQESASIQSPIICARCRALGRASGRAENDQTKPAHCACCRALVSDDCTRNRDGEVLCADCRNEPDEILRRAVLDTGDGAHSPIDRYEVTRKIGVGGMGAVYEASHRKTGKKVAIKLLLPQIAASREAIGRFLREINITKVLSHKHIVGLLDSDHSNGVFFLCLEYCAGGSVSDLMESSGGRLTVEQATAIVFQVLDALAYAHSLRISGLHVESSTDPPGQGLVHRDIKPKNILLSNKGKVDSVKICDFGLSKAFDLSGLSGLTCTGEIAGSPYFMCRQQVINFKYAKHEVDIWSTAATLYNMLTGEHPRDFSLSRDPWQIVLETEPVPIRKRLKTIPPRLAEVIDEALQEQEPASFQTATQLRAALAAAL